jgi:hypothetical protein
VLPLGNMVHLSIMVNKMHTTAYQAALSNSKEERHEIQKTMDSLKIELLDIYRKEEERTFTEKGKQVLDNSAKCLNEYANAYNKFITDLNKGAVKGVPEELRNKADEIIDSNTEFITMKEDIAEAINEDATKTYYVYKNNTITLLVLMTVAIIGFGIFSSRAQNTSGTKKCPYCAEEIKKEAIVCRFCNRDLVKRS